MDAAQGSAPPGADNRTNPPQKAALDQRVAQQAALAALSQAALAETSIDALLDRVVHCVADTLRTEFAKVLELAPNGGELLLRAGVGWTPGLVGRATVPAGRGSQAGFTLLEDGPVVVTDFRTETRFTGPPLLVDHGVVSGVSCAIRRLDGRPFGVLGTHTRSARQFSDNDVAFLRSVANVLAAAIGRLQVEEALREAELRLAAEVRSLARLNELSSRLWQMRGLNEGLEEMLHATVALLGADKGNIQLLKGGVLRIVAQHGFERAFLEYFREVTVEDDSACARAVRSGEAIVIDDVEADEPYALLRPVAREAGYRAVLSTPLIGGDGDTVGVVSVHFQSPHRPNDQELQRLTLYVRQAADFIERCRAEQELHESEQRFRIMADNAPVLIWRSGLDKLCTWFNKPWLDFTGRTIEQELGNGWTENVHPDDFGRCLQTYSAAFDARRPFSMEYRLKRHDEEYRWVLDNGIPLLGNRGEFMGYIGSCIDITDRKRAEEVLRENEARQAYLVRLDDALRPLADAGAIQNAAARVLGEHLRATRAMYADVEGEPGSEVGIIRSRYHGDDAQDLAAFPERYPYSVFGERMMALRRRGETMVVDDVTSDPAFDASERAAWVANDVRAAVTVSLVKEGRMMADLGVQSATARAWTAQEIALVEATAERTWEAVERARAQKELRQTEAQSRRFVDYHQAVMANMGEGLYTLDGQGLVTYMNPAAERLFQWKSAELVGRRMHDMTHYQHPDGTPFPVEDCAGFQVLHHARVVTDRDDVFIRRDGTFFDVVYSSAPLVFEGHVTGVVVVFRDVTDRKRAEEALRESEARLASLFDALPLGVGVIDAEGKLVVSNPEMRRYMPNRMIPSRDHTIAWRWRATHPDGRPIDRTDYPGARALRGERVVPGVEFQYTRDDGREVWIQFAAVPLRATDGRVAGQVIVINDIDAAKRAEEALRLSVDIARTINDATTWDDAMHRVLRRLCQSQRWQTGYVYLPQPGRPERLAPAVSCYADERFRPFHDFSMQQTYARGEHLPGRVYAENTPLWAENREALLTALPMRAAAATTAGLCAAVAVPVAIRGEVVAVLELFSDQVHPADDEMRALMQTVSDQIGRILEREQATARMADVVWREQQELLHTLHDSLGQTLTGLGMLSTGLRQRLPADSEAGETAVEIARQTQHALDQVRQLAKKLFPVEVEAESLMAALRDLASATESLHKIDVRVQGESPEALHDGKIATELYRIAQEAVTNSVKHGRAKTITIGLEGLRELTQLTIADDGIGIPHPIPGYGAGLQIMRYRATSIGASLSVERGRTGGTIVTCTIRQPPMSRKGQT